MSPGSRTALRLTCPFESCILDVFNVIVLAVMNAMLHCCSFFGADGWWTSRKADRQEGEQRLAAAVSKDECMVS